MKSYRSKSITIRVDQALKSKLITEARRRGRNFSDHIREKLAGEDELDATLTIIEQRTRFTVQSFYMLFEGLGRKDEILALLEELDLTDDLLAETGYGDDRLENRTTNL